MKYTPRGKDGLPFPLAFDFGLTAPPDEYIRRANLETMIVTQVETRESFANIDEILGVEEIDVVFVDP